MIWIAIITSPWALFLGVTMLFDKHGPGEEIPYNRRKK